MHKKPITFQKDAAHISEKEIQSIAQTLGEYINHCNSVVESGKYEADESSLNCPADKQFQVGIAEVLKTKVSSELKFIVVCGIGGSNLGTKAIYESMVGTVDPHLNARPKILFLDTVSAHLMMDVVELLSNEISDPEQVLINVVTKSGGTAETISNLETLAHALEQKIGSVKDRIVVSTDEGSALWDAAGEQGITRLAIPKKVGGRFSVFSVVGQFPLRAAGLDVSALLEGASAMLDRCLQATTQENPALASAAITYAHHQSGIKINNTFLFNPELESVGKWYRQLMGESLGKKQNLDDKEVREGITPIVSIGSTDLHSMAQMYFGGPQDKLTTFVHAKQLPTQVKVPEKLLFPGMVENIQGKSYKKIMLAILGGVKKAYQKNRQPYMEIELQEINEYVIGQYLQFKMCEMMYLGRLLNLNPFNQPSVEDYKSETRNLLKG